MKLLIRSGLLAVVLILIPMMTRGQRADYSKMSPLVREAAMVRERDRQNAAKAYTMGKRQVITAFVRIDRADAEPAEVLGLYGCTPLANFGDIYIAEIPLASLRELSLHKAVTRIEAGRRSMATMDTVPRCVNVLPVYEGEAPLEQAFTGKGVIVGVMDMGFDLTHPNFYSRDMSEYRIKRLWDQLSTDTVGSGFYVGREYTTQEELLDLKHSRDGLIATHGTHTTGTAAGSGYTTEYPGIAYGSDICLVNNALLNNAELIDSADLYKYTLATDMLGLKYIFDYADEVGKPCVISLSQGMYEDMYGESKMYQECIDSLVGPGRILVASAGNQAVANNYFHKPVGTESMGVLLYSGGETSAMLKCRNSEPFNFRFVIYKTDEGRTEVISSDTLLISSTLPLLATDSLFADTLHSAVGDCEITTYGYPSCYNTEVQPFNISIKDISNFSENIFTSMEVVGEEADVEFYLQNGNIIEYPFTNTLTTGEPTHNILTPGSAPAAICVGATAYRQGVVNSNGTFMEASYGADGMWARFSSVGPTVDERIKPDVMAPGVNVISSYNSYYMETNATESIKNWNVGYTEYDGRQYPWDSDTGTSMSTPVVAGVIALWLEAKPDLTREEIMGVLARTCRHNDETMNYPNNYYGYGEIDAYAGLLDILGLSAGIEGLPVNHTGASVGLSGDYLLVKLPEGVAGDIRMDVYSCDGMKRMSATLGKSPTEQRIDVSQLASGVYAVRLSGDKAVNGSALFRK